VLPSLLINFDASSLKINYSSKHLNSSICGHSHLCWFVEPVLEQCRCIFEWIYWINWIIQSSL